MILKVVFLFQSFFGYHCNKKDDFTISLKKKSLPKSLILAICSGSVAASIGEYLNKKLWPGAQLLRGERGRKIPKGGFLHLSRGTMLIIFLKNYTRIINSNHILESYTRIIYSNHQKKNWKIVNNHDQLRPRRGEGKISPPQTG